MTKSAVALPVMVSVIGCICYFLFGVDNGGGGHAYQRQYHVLSASENGGNIDRRSAEVASNVAAGSDYECHAGAVGEGECDLPSIVPPVGLIDVRSDPKLVDLPGMDHKAYLRSDISTFYREQPGSREEKTPSFNGQAGKFVNMSPYHVSLFWVGPKGNILIGSIAPFEAGGSAVFPTHKFIMSRPNKPDEAICEFEVRRGTAVYYYDPYDCFEAGKEYSYDELEDNEFLQPSRGLVNLDAHDGGSCPSLDSLSQQDREYYDVLKHNLVFGSKYKNFTGGSEWLSVYTRNPPFHKMYTADYYGQQHHVSTVETHFTTQPPKSELRRSLKPQDMKRVEGVVPLREYREPGTLNLTITALSCEPRVFEIRNFLSDVEVEHVLKLLHDEYQLERSTTDGRPSDTRTSRTTWIYRHSDTVLDAIFRRVADALGLDEALLRSGASGEHRRTSVDLSPRGTVNEAMQIVHYQPGQEYTAHHDFGYPHRNPNNPTRTINLAMYFNDVIAGGETAFPRWRNGETRDALKVKPEKGKAIIFYMINPDGNFDDLSQHAAKPVIKGEKYFANLWIRDPYHSA